AADLGDLCLAVLLEFVVEIGQRPLLELALVYARRVEPGVSFLVELSRCVADCGVRGKIGRLLAGRPRGREGFKGGGRRTARWGFERGSDAQQPDLMQLRVQHAEEVVIGSGEDHQLVIRMGPSIQPDEMSVFGYGRCHNKSFQGCYRIPHPWTSIS